MRARFRTAGREWPRAWRRFESAIFCSGGDCATVALKRVKTSAKISRESMRSSCDDDACKRNDRRLSIHHFESSDRRTAGSDVHRQSEQEALGLISDMPKRPGWSWRGFQQSPSSSLWKANMCDLSNSDLMVLSQKLGRSKRTYQAKRYHAAPPLWTRCIRLSDRL